MFHFFQKKVLSKILRIWSLPALLGLSAHLWSQSHTYSQLCSFLGLYSGCYFVWY